MSSLASSLARLAGYLGGVRRPGAGRQALAPAGFRPGRTADRPRIGGQGRRRCDRRNRPRSIAFVQVRPNPDNGWPSRFRCRRLDPGPPQHPRGKVYTDDVKSRPGERQGIVAGAASQVEHTPVAVLPAADQPIQPRPDACLPLASLERIIPGMAVQAPECRFQPVEPAVVLGHRCSPPPRCPCWVHGMPSQGTL